VRAGLGVAVNLKYILFPKNNQWRKRTALVLAFMLFDYFSTLVFCRAPFQEANLYARALMEALGAPIGLTLFVLVISLPIYVILTLDSHMIRLPLRIAILAELLVDIVFAWYVAGSHFSGGVSWFWSAPDFLRQAVGAITYFALAFVFCKLYRQAMSSRSS